MSVDTPIFIRLVEYFAQVSIYLTPNKQSAIQS